MKDETETENKKIYGQIRAFSEDLNLTKSIILDTENKVERNFLDLNNTVLRNGFIWIFVGNIWGERELSFTLHLTYR